MQLFSSTVGRKILMAITGQLMVLFVVVHLLGNSTIYVGWLNAYAHHLHAMPPLVWAFRLVMLLFVGIHACYGVMITLENNAANPGAYAVSRQLKAVSSSPTSVPGPASLLSTKARASTPPCRSHPPLAW